MNASHSTDRDSKIRALLRKAASCIKHKDGHCSPNYALLAIALTLFLAALLCGTSLWIPASRIENLHIRAVALAAADAFSSFASSTGLDKAVPSLRAAFLEAAGLEGNIDWDSRYFNRRERYAAAVEQPGQAALDTVLPYDALAQKGQTGELQASMPLPAYSASYDIHSADNPLRVYVFGDSQAYSIGIGLSRLAGRNSSIDVDYLSVHSSGFIRQDYFSWEQKLTDTFSEAAYDAGIVVMGMNDYQNFWADDGTVAVKETPFWEEAYKEKCRAIIDTALMYLPKVYWIGMPLVKNSVYSGHLAYIESVQRSLAEEYSPDVLAYVSLRDVIPGRGEPYTDILVTSDGKQFRIMSDDGTHFTVEGGQLAMKPVFDLLCRDFLFSELPVAHMPE